MSALPSSLSAEARHDLDPLLHRMLERAVERLEAEGGFLPFAGAVGVDGRLQVAAAAADAASLSAEEQLVLLGKGLRSRAERHEIRASCLVADVKVSIPGKGDSDAIRARLEHRLGEAIEVFLPYRRDRGGGLDLADLEGAPASCQVFDRPKPS